MNAVRIEAAASAKTMDRLHVVPRERKAPRGSFDAEVYRLHSYRLVDADGAQVGLVDWIWTDETSGYGEFLGVNLRWLRGTARAIPSLGAEIDHETATIRVAHTRAQITRARRYKIDRSLTAYDKRRICFHYELQPATLPSLVPAVAA